MATHLDLFSGIGGFALAARWAGFKTVGFCEKDPFCQQILKKHWPDVYIFPDIETMNHFGKIDLLTGGFPCQPFSVAGKKKGIKDDRYLWPNMLRVIHYSRPTWVVAENVTGLINLGLDTVIMDLENKGYSVRVFNIPACSAGAPHRRERLWIIAHCNRERLGDRCNFGKRGHLQTDPKRYLAALQQDWSQFKLESWATFDAQNWFQSTDASCESGGQTDTRTLPESNSGESWLRSTRANRAIETTFNWEKDKPPVCGVDNGVSKGLDLAERNKALGNAIVPQVAYPILKIIRDLL